MMNRYDPFREAMSLRHAMDQLFAQSYVHPSSGQATQANFAPMDVYETEHGYQMRVAMPGVKPEDIDVTVHQNTITIRGHSQSQTGPEQEQSQTQNQGQAQGQSQAVQRRQRGNWLVREISSVTFERSVAFDRPIDSDKIETQYEHGILTLTVPVSEASRPRKISVKGSSSQSQTGHVNVASGSEQG